MSVFNELKRKQAERLEETRKEYWLMLDQMDINDPTRQQATNLERMLNELGKTAEDAEAEYKLIRQLRQWEAEAELLAERKDAARTAHQERQDWIQERKRLEKEQEAKTRRLAGAAASADTVSHKSLEARKQLRDGYELNPELFATLRLPLVESISDPSKDSVGGGE